ncbi:uncharacterized protein O3C94_010243 [Discoglossus pictus]
MLKDYVSKAVFTLANSLTPSTFNLFHFSQEVTKWCNRAVTCNPETAAEAASWVRTLGYEPGASPIDALTAAFEEPDCQAVHLVMDALPGSVLHDIYSLLARHKDASSVDVSYLDGEPRESYAEVHFKTVTLQPSESSSKVSSSCSYRSEHCCRSLSLDVLPSRIHHGVQMSLLSCSHNTQEPPISFKVKEDSGKISTEALCLLRGARILARRKTDGLYYLGHIAHEVESSPEHFLVEFEKCRVLKGKAQFRMQETALCDIIHYEDARWKPLVPGDHVLAPLESNMEQHGPGIVLQGSESRTCALAFESSGVLVTFWNGKTKRIPPGLAIWVPQHLSERIILELQMPVETRKQLTESTLRYSCTAPLDCSASRCQSQQTLKSVCGLDSHTCLYCSPSHGLCHKCHLYEEQLDALRRSMSQNRKKQTKEKRNRKGKMDGNLKEGSSYEINHRREKKNKKSVKVSRGSPIVEHRSSPVTQKEPLVCDSMTKRIINKYNSPERPAPETAEASTMTGAAKSSNDPSAASLANMTSLQATLHCIDKAMKEDRLALEAAIRERRPRMAQLLQSYEQRAQKSQELKERKEAAQTDLWRLQAEQRHRRMEEKIMEGELRDQMLQDNRRLRSEQRIQLDLERKQDQEGLESQQAESRRAAAEDRAKKQEHALGTERRKEEQRVQYLTERRKYREVVDLEPSRKHQEQEEKRKKLQQSRMEAAQRKQESATEQWHRHQALQEAGKRRSNRRLEEFYQKVEQESHKDKDLQQYLKEHNLQALRSAMVL